MQSKSYQVVSQEFSENFPQGNVPNKTTIGENVKKYREDWDEACLIKHIYVSLQDFTFD